jgi:hypothetical protein
LFFSYKYLALLLSKEPKLKVAAGICEYGDTDGLYRCLNSLGLGTGGIDLAIVIHGRFRDFKLDKPDAFKETQKIVSRFPDGTVELVQLPPNSTEIEARNLYLKTAADLNCDWLLVIDSDEFLPNRLADFKDFRRQLEYVMDLGLEHQIFDVHIEGNIPAYRGPAPRLFLRPGTIKYWGKHYWFVLEKTMRIYKGQSDAARIITGIIIAHDHTIRDSTYYNASVGYKEWQQAHEGEEIQTEVKSKRLNV